METKGNPIDSVIQYQLHKKSSGGNGDFECKFNGVKKVNITYSEEIELTSEYYDSLTDFEKSLIGNGGGEVGDFVKWIYTDIKPIDFINYPFAYCYLFGIDSMGGTTNIFSLTKVIYLAEESGIYEIGFDNEERPFIDIGSLRSNNINSNFTGALILDK